VLFRGRRRDFALQLPQERGDVDGLHVSELVNALPFAPGRKPPGRVEVGIARMVIVDLRRKEFHDAPGGLWRGRE
jgi:hypothetical protein